MQWNPIAWILTGAMVPFIKAMMRNRGEPTADAQFISGLYGYLVVCGVLFNCMVLITFIAEVLL